MPNKTYIKRGLIVHYYDGDQTSETVDKHIKGTVRFGKQLRKKGEPVLILVDTINVGKNTVGARQRGTEYIQRGDFDKIATFGGNRILHHVINLVFSAAGKSQKVKDFKTRTEAERWLRS